MIRDQAYWTLIGLTYFGTLSTRSFYDGVDLAMNSSQKIGYVDREIQASTVQVSSLGSLQTI